MHRNRNAFTLISLNFICSYISKFTLFTFTQLYIDLYHSKFIVEYICITVKLVIMNKYALSENVICFSVTATLRLPVCQRLISETERYVLY